MLDSKRILLIHPLGYSAAVAKTDVSRLANIMPPLGLASIAAYLETKGLFADITDYYANPFSDSLVLEYLRDKRPAFVGISCTTNGFLDALRIGQMVKAESTCTKVALGGPHISALRGSILLNNPEVDYAIIGEGEQTLEELMLRGVDAPEAIPGLCFWNGEEVVFNGFRPRGMNMDDLPFPAYDKLYEYPRGYQLPIFNYPKTPNTSCISSRGCPYSCSYCDRSVFRKSFSYNSAEYLYEHLKYLKARYGIKHINFYDDQFTFNRKRIVEFCERMQDRPLGMTFNCAVRAEHVDPELLSAMKQSGCWMVSLGIETGDAELLAQHRLNVDLEMMRATVLDIKRAGIRVKALLMMGLPGETEESIERSKKYVFSLPIDDLNLTKFTPFPGSPIYERIHEQGTFDEDLTKMDCMHFQFVPHGFTQERLDELFILFYKNYFQRPSVWWNYITMLWKSPDSWRRLLLNAGGFLRFILSNKRIQEN